MHSATILVADDSSDIRIILQRLLTDSGYRVVVAANGQEVISLARQHRPELVLLDLNMPVLDGWEAARSIRTEPALDETLIVAITAYRLSSTTATALAAGCHSVLFKPFDLAELLNSIVTLMATAKQLGQAACDSALAVNTYPYTAAA